MVSCEAAFRNSEKTFDLMDRGEEKDLGIQIFGGDPDIIRKSMPLIAESNPTVLDLNCGCPVPKIIKSGAGSALMKEPKKIEQIVRILKEGLEEAGHSEIPVTVKIRSGWDMDSLNYLEAAESAVKGGASMISLHPRTRSQGYSGTADWNHIRELKKELDVPLIGSGDLFSPFDAQRMLEETGCDGVMFAREQSEILLFSFRQENYSKTALSRKKSLRIRK